MNKKEIKAQVHSLIEADTGARLDLLEVARSVLDFDSLDNDFVRRRLRKTLEPHALDAMVQTVRGAGYRFSASA